MSSMERNKGVLKPVSVNTENFTGEDFETYRENGFFVINGEIYRSLYEVKRETDHHGFSEVEIDESGNIHFHTLHYNGGGSLEEVIEMEISK